jgi:hypothetical protein
MNWARSSAHIHLSRPTSRDLPELACAEQDRDQRGADEIVLRRAPTGHRPFPACAARTRHMNEADHAGARACKRQIERLIADITARVDGKAAAEARAAKGCRYLAARKARLQVIGRAGNDRAGTRACAGRVAVNQAQPVECSGFNVQKSPPRGKAKMQYNGRLQRLVEALEYCGNFGIMNRQHSTLELKAEALKSCLLVFERADKRRRRILPGAGKRSKTSHQNFYWQGFMPGQAISYMVQVQVSLTQIRLFRRRSQYRHVWRRKTSVPVSQFQFDRIANPSANHAAS